VEEMVNLEFCLTVMLKFPLASAVVALLVPVSVTVANGMGVPFSSLTVPVIVRDWPNANVQSNISTDSSDAIFLM
jgi:hypothetical protein